MHIRHKRICFLAGVAAATLIVGARPSLAATEPQQIDLPQQNLADELRAIARVTGRDIMFASDAVGDRPGKPLHGMMTADQAVDLLLSGSDLIADHRSDGILVRGRDTNLARGTAPVSTPDITVTGSRIRGAPVASPVITITQADMSKAGQFSLADAVRDIPQNFNGGQNPGIGLNVPESKGSYIGASTGLNLRGLGGDATLTLLNGQRLSYNASLQSIDISSIPIGIVDRIEVVADGSSALYGSDAVAGVANVILRRDYDGVSTSARFGAATDGGDEQQQYDLAGGQKWDSGGFVLAYDFDRQTQIVARERSYAADRSPGLTLYPSLKHHSVAGSIHQNLTPDLSFEVDTLFNKRWSYSAYAVDASGDVFGDGGDTANEDEAFTIAPRLKYDTPWGWRTQVSGSYGFDHARYAANSYYLDQNIYTSAGCYCNSANSIEASADGPLFRVPAGPIRLAVGAGLRTNYFNATRTAGFSQEVTATQREYYGYGEVEIPLVSPDLSIPLVYRLNLTAAARYDDYRGVGKVTTPKFGLIFAPTPDIELKASWGRSFKAPTLYQQYNASSTTLRTAASVGGTNYPAGATALVIAGGNPDLRPERARTWTGTLAIHPRAVDGLRIELSYFNVHYKDRIVVPVTYIAQALSNPIYADLVTLNPSDAEKAAATADPDNFVNGVGGVYNPADVVAIIHDNNLNAASQRVHGVDVDIRYHLDTGKDASLDLTGSAAYIHSTQKLSDLQPSISLAGAIFNPPHFRARGGAVWTKAGVTISGFLNYIGGVQDVRSSPSVHVGSMTTLDLTASYAFQGSTIVTRGLSIALSASNITNDKPSVIENQVYETPYDSTNYAPFGRVVSLSVSKKW